jgi:O-antigen biosynthesis protein
MVLRSKVKHLVTANPGEVRPLAPDSQGEFTPTCTVVICTRERPTHLDHCLEAVMRLVYSSFDVLVVDNAPRDAQTRDVAARWGVRYVVEPAVGLSRARNQAMRECHSDVIAFLDDDALPDPEWLTGLAREFEDPRVMAVGGRILPLSVETEGERLCAMINNSDSRGSERRVVDRQVRSWFELANFGGVGDGGNMAFRGRTLEIWPGFEERLGRGAILHGSEEHHAFFSLIERGYRVVYTPHAVVRHPYPRTLQELRARHLSELTGFTGYLTLLLVEEPRYRRATLRYVIEALTGTPHPWRSRAASPHPRLVPRWRMLLACLCGPFRYAQSRLTYPPPVSLEIESDGSPALDAWHTSNVKSLARESASPK